MKAALPLMNSSSALWSHKIALGCCISLALVWAVYFLQFNSSLSLDELKNLPDGVDEYVKGSLGNWSPWYSQGEEENNEGDSPEQQEPQIHSTVGDDFSHQALQNPPPPSQPTKQPKPSNAWNDEAAFRKAWIETEIGGPEDWTRLEELCNQTEWRSDIVLNMVGSRGGIGNVRGTILDLIHFTIRVGVAHLILPSYVRRVEETLDWMDESQGWWPFSHLFDETYFTAVMAAHCPQMTLYASEDEAPFTAQVKPKYEVPRARTDLSTTETVVEMIGDFASWIADKQPGYEDGELNLVVVAPTLWAYDLLPSPRLRRTLGRLLKINPDIRQLAAKAMYNLRMGGHGLKDVIDPRRQIYGKDGFYGMHLRTEQDATAVSWLADFGGYESQAAIHLAKCQTLGLKVIYLATGDKKDVDRFKEQAMDEANITVVTKHDLLFAPEDAAALEAISWDQNGVLDWEVLSRSSFFSGPVMSSFAWNVALRRHYYTPEDMHLENPLGVQEDEPQVAWDDGLSRVMLRSHLHLVEILAPRGMFP